MLSSDRTQAVGAVLFRKVLWKVVFILALLTRTLFIVAAEALLESNDFGRNSDLV